MEEELIEILWSIRKNKKHPNRAFKEIVQLKEKYDEKFLLHLIDVVWMEAKESEEVPSTIWRKEMIETAKKTLGIYLMLNNE